MCHRCLGDVGAQVQGVKDGPQLTVSKETETLVLQPKGIGFSQ